MRKRSLWLIGVIAIGLMLVAACGDDDDDDDGGAAAPAPAATEAPAAANGAPVAAFTTEPSCTTSNTTAVTLTSTSTDPDDDALTHAWEISSGTPSSATGEVVTGVTFPNIAPYPITLTVTDDAGASDSATMSVAPC